MKCASKSWKFRRVKIRPIPANHRRPTPLSSAPNASGPKASAPRGGQKGHNAHQQQMLEPTRVENLLPERCTCGCQDFTGQPLQPFHTHQHIELPPIQLDITHYVLNKCRCPNCGKTVRAQLPPEAQTGCGPRLSALIAELSGIRAMSRVDVQCFLRLGARAADRHRHHPEDRRSGFGSAGGPVSEKRR